MNPNHNLNIKNEFSRLKNNIAHVSHLYIICVKEWPFSILGHFGGHLGKLLAAINSLIFVRFEKFFHSCFSFVVLFNVNTNMKPLLQE